MTDTTKNTPYKAHKPPPIIIPDRTIITESTPPPRVEKLPNIMEADDIHSPPLSSKGTINFSTTEE
eukprot:2828591-Ditylum_brightwellii.AAC.1